MLRLSAFVPLNFFRVQNLIAANPSGRPSVVTARLECMRIPHTVCCRGRESFFLPVNDLCRIPIASTDSREYVNSVVS